MEIHSPGIKNRRPPETGNRLAMEILQNDVGLVTVHPLGNVVKDNFTAGFHRLSRGKGHMGSYDGVLAVQQR